MTEHSLAKAYSTAARASEGAAYEMAFYAEGLFGRLWGINQSLIEFNSHVIGEHEFAEEYPEHHKLDSLGERRGAVQDFLDWLCDDEGLVVCRWRESGNNGEPRYLDPDTGEPTSFQAYKNRSLRDKGHYISEFHMEHNPKFESWPEGFYPDRRGREELMASYFDIDLKRLSQEKDRMFEELVKRNGG